MKTFEDLLRRLDDLQIEKDQEREKLMAESKEESLKIWESHYPKKKFSYGKFDDLPESKEFQEKTKRIANNFHDKFYEKSENLKEQLRVSAEKVEIPKSDCFLRWKTVYTYSYSSQGYGAASYARRNAESKADKARANDVEVEIRKSEEGFEVWVKTTEIGLKLLDYKPEIDLIEQVRLIYKRGGNPRVFFPFLPYGFEEQNGLDYHGGRK